MAVVFSVIAVVAFVLSIVQAGLSFLRWIREPTFEVLQASFATEKRGERLWAVKGGTITVVAFGGARTRKVVNWKFMLFRWTENGRGSGAGINAVVEPILETIPAHESTKFTLNVESGIAGLEEEIPEKLVGELHLRVDKYWTCVDFQLRRSTGNFYLDRPVESDFPWMTTRLPWWKRVVDRLRRLV